jgi:hypothetical protein
MRTGLEHRIAILAVYVELELRGNCIADADMSRAPRIPAIHEGL